MHRSKYALFSVTVFLACLFGIVALFAPSAARAAPVGGTPAPLPPPSLASAGVISYTGRSDTKIDTSIFRQPSLVRIWGYSQGGTLSITGGGVGWIVKSTPYYGEILLNYYIDRGSAELAISTSSEWRVEILPLAQARVLKSPGSLTGEGDRVVLVRGEPVDAVRIQADGDSDVSVDGYGHREMHLLSTEAAADAVIRTHEPIQVFTVKSESAWSLTVPPTATETAKVVPVVPTVAPTPAVVVATQAPTAAGTPTIDYKALEQNQAALLKRVAILEAAVASQTHAVANVASPVLVATSTPAPTSKYEYELVSIQDKIVESNSVFDKRAWIMVIKNNTAQTLVFNAKVEFLDDSGFIEANVKNPIAKARGL